MSSLSRPRFPSVAVLRELGFLRTPQWIVVTVLMAGLIPAFWHLSSWQFHRLDDRRLLNSTVAEAISQPARPLAELLSPAYASRGRATDWMPVWVTGTWLPNSTVYARRHWREDRMGFYVVSTFRPSDGGVLAVVRGFTPASRSATDTPQVTGPPSGTVKLHGWLRTPEPTDTREVPSGQVSTINNAALNLTTQSRTAMWLLVNHRETPLPAIVSAPDQLLQDLNPPPPSEGPHHSYAWQWRAFVVLVVGGWCALVRSELRQRRSAVSDVTVE